MSGRNAILRRLNAKALNRFPYLLPNRKVPSMKSATAPVVLPSMWRTVDRGTGIEIPKKDSAVPAAMDRIKGFLGRHLTILPNPSRMEELRSP